MASYLHHTATTKYPCCVPALGDSEGASCVGLAGANLQSIFSIPNENFLIFYVTILNNWLLIFCFELIFEKQQKMNSLYLYITN